MYEDLIKQLRDAATINDALTVLLPHGEGNAVAKLLREAADAIEQLSAKYDMALTDLVKQTKPRWIPVTERLPNVDETKDEYENVTVIASSRGWKKSRPLIYERACVRGKTVYRWKYISGRIYDGLPVTHWMPLPSTEGLNET